MANHVINSARSVTGEGGETFTLVPRDGISDLQLAFETLRSKERVYQRLWKYYDGDHPLVFSSQKLQDVFQNLGLSDIKFEENWCQVIVDTVLRRMNLIGFNVGDDDLAQQTLDDILYATRLKLEYHDIHLAMLVCGEGFVIADEDDGKFQAFYNDPRRVHVFYNGMNPRKMDFAAKWWRVRKELHMLLYYSDRFEHYVSNVDAENLQSHESLVPARDVPQANNTWGRIPVFHFRKELRTIAGELTRGVLAVQDAINKLLSDAMVTAEFTAFQQRWVIGNFDEQTIKAQPGTFVQFPGAPPDEQQVSTGTYAASDVTPLLEFINHLINVLSSMTSVPRHYFDRSGSGTLSGEALIALEAPLNKKAKVYQERVDPTWKEFASFVLERAKVKVDASAIETVWCDPETVQPKTRAEMRKINRDAGLPLATILRDEGWTEDEIEQMRNDMVDENVLTKGSTTGPSASPAQQAIRRHQMADAAEENATPAIENLLKNTSKEVVSKLKSDGSIAKVVR